MICLGTGDKDNVCPGASRENTPAPSHLLLRAGPLGRLGFLVSPSKVPIRGRADAKRDPNSFARFRFQTLGGGGGLAQQ